MTEQLVPEQQPGRRIYIQEQAVVRHGLHSRDRFVEMLQCAASLTIPRVYAHAESELEIWEGRTPKLPADKLVADLGYRALQSNFFQRIAVKSLEESGPSGAVPVLGPEERIAANCYFSNYYTLATGDSAAEDMFRDTSSISSIKELPPAGLTLISPKNLREKLTSSDYQDWVEGLDIRAETTTFTASAISHIYQHNDAGDVGPLSAAVENAADRLSIRLTGLANSIISDMTK